MNHSQDGSALKDYTSLCNMNETINYFVNICGIKIRIVPVLDDESP